MKVMSLMKSVKITYVQIHMHMSAHTYAHTYIRTYTKTSGACYSMYIVKSRAGDKL